MALSRRKKLLFAAAAMALSFAGMLLVLLAADLVLHYRAERSAGLNRYGYRGPVVAGKQPGELRVVVLGGSTAFGYGVAWHESIPALLETRLGERLARPVTVVNLGFNNEGSFAFLPNLQDFEYLDYDVVVLYEGYNDLPGDAGVNQSVYRRDSAIYRWIGYYPILPLYLDEKAKMMRYGSDLNAAYDADRDEAAGRAVFRPTLAQRTSAGALEAVAAMTKVLDGQLANAAAMAPTLESESTLGCRAPNVTFCESVARAVRFGLARGNGVVVASQPRLVGPVAKDVHIRQQEMLAGMMARTFGGDARVVWADFSGLVDLHSIDVTFDAMHLKPEANATVAAALVEPVLAAAAGAGIK
jgi:hypothetical protein